MIRLGAAHPTVSNLLMILILGAGLMVAPKLLRETLPHASLDTVEVAVTYPGARPEDVETTVCLRIENALATVTGIDTQSCEAREGVAREIVTMRQGHNFQAFTADIKSAVEAISDFPSRVDPPVIRPLGLTDAVASVAITGPKSRTALKDYAEQTRTRMLRWGGIPKVDIRGFSTREIRVALHPDALRQFGLSVADVARVLAAANVDVPAGSIETKAETLLVRVAEQRQTPATLAALIVRSSRAGGRVRLGDIAEVSETFPTIDDRILFDGQPAAVLDITKTSDQDSLRVMSRLQGFLAAARKQAPPGVGMKVISDVTTKIRGRLNLIEINGLQGLALVLLVLWPFFGLRFGFWVAMGLPVALMGGIALMGLVGYSLNMMTSMGLVIVIGLVMDDAIVIAENVARLRETGLGALDSVIQGTSQVMTNVVASFVTTAMVLGSLAFLTGSLGEVLRVVPVVMLFVLAVSLIEAFFILPHHLLHSLRHPRNESKWRQGVDRAMDFTRERLVGPLVVASIRWRYAVTGLSLTLLLVAISMVAGGYLKFKAFPSIDGDTVVARILLPQGTPSARTKAVVARVERGLDKTNAALSPKQPGGARLVRHVTVFYGVNTDAFETGANVATISVDLLPSNLRNSRPQDITAHWRKAVGAIPDVISLRYSEPGVGRAGRAIDLRLKGDNLATLKAASTDLKNWLWQYRGVTSVMDDLRAGKRELRITLKDTAGPMGITAGMIADQLRAAYYGTTVSQMQVRGQELDVISEIGTLGGGLPDSAWRQFDDFVIARSDGSQVPLSVVANITITQGYNRINRENGRRTVTVQGSIDTRIANAKAIVGDTIARFIPRLLKNHPGVKLDIEGQNAEARKTQKSMMKGFVIGLIGVFLLLSFLFRSYVEPIVVMLIIPLSLVGAIFGHMAMGVDFSMPSLLGYVALAGVVVNNSILLVDFVKHEHGNALTVAEAAARAAKSRFRAMFLTTATTIAGLIPILLATNVQAQVLIPMVASLAFGLLASAIFVLFVLPGIYAILDDLGFSTLARERRDREAAQRL